MRAGAVVKKVKPMKWLERHLIVAPYHFGLCTTQEQFKRELKRLKVPDADSCDFINRGSMATTHHLETPKGSRCSIVCMPKTKDPRIETDTILVHEAVHIWQEIREVIGERSPSIEFEAYSIQNISARLIEAYWGK